MVQWSKALLLGLLEVGDTFVDVMLSTSYKGGPTLLPKRTLGSYWALRSLERRGYVRLISKRTHRYALTGKGRRRALELQVRSAPARRRVWDGRWRVIIFDVPERRRAARDFLRRELRLAGFCQLHRSVWIAPFDPPPGFDALLDEVGLRSSSRLLLVEAMNYDDDLRRSFGIPLRRRVDPVKTLPPSVGGQSTKS